jgi:hypothetical protein
MATKKRLKGWKWEWKCKDCGIGPWDFVEDERYVHEDFYVHDVLWDRVCPDDLRAERELPNGLVGGIGFVICIGCFEARLGRTLTKTDFKVPPQHLFGDPPSKRFMDRWGASGSDRSSGTSGRAPRPTGA